ncbi:MAG: putative zinc-binding metallopeptidase [Alphaproteobacteria bacterium]
MKNFRCACGNTVFYENTLCNSCSRRLGFLPDLGTLAPLEPLEAPGPGGAENGGRWRALVPGAASFYRRCRNDTEYQVCNWMVAAGDPNDYCASCRLNSMIPNLGDPRSLVLWFRVEQAKRWLLYTLQNLGLPIIGKAEDPAGGLAFEFLADAGSSEFCDTLDERQRITTGHRRGVITINIAEADPSAREQMRERMNEQYRTLLGHFRHESGHYYWDRLVNDTPWLQRFRDVFDDERADYDAALRRYYTWGPKAGWQQSFISGYAAAHPWEDWAETWAHYLHITDTLETAWDQGFSVRGRAVGPQTMPAQWAAPPSRADAAMSFDGMLADWTGLAIGMNALNRSMGLPDPYPFVLANPVIEKLRFVYDLIGAARRT